jgi:twinkle protein
MDVRQYLYSKGFKWKEVRRTGGQNAIMNCPFCGDTEQKFAVLIETGAFKCMHLNRCGVSGSFWELQKMLGDAPQRLNSERTVQVARKVSYKKINAHADPLSAKVLEYLHGRGFKDEIIKQFKIGQKDNDTVAYPFFKSGKVVNVKYRSIKEKKFWSEESGEPVLFNRDSVEGETLYITEGQDDCIALAHYGIIGTSVPNGTGDERWVEHEWDFLQQFKTIILLFDNDAAGYEAVQSIVNRLGKWRCYHIILPEKDINGCLAKGVTQEALTEAMMNPVEFNDKRVTSAISMVDELIEYSKDERKLYGIPTASKGLNKLIKGWRPKELTVWTGNSGSGKSTQLNLEIISLLKRKEKALTASLEMPPLSYLRWAVMQYVGQMEQSESIIRATLEEIGYNWYTFNHRGAVVEDVLMDAFEFAARKYGVRHFVIDSLMKVQLKGREELKAEKDFCARLTDFADEFDCHVHLVAHPRKGFKDTDRPDKVDVAGSANITNQAHNVLTMYRYTEEQKKAAYAKGGSVPDSVLTVKKNREWGLEGSVDFMFQADCKRLVEVI